MQTKLRSRVLPAFLLAVFVVVLPAMGGPVDVAPLRAVYDGHLAQFESEYNAEMDAWAKGYRQEVAQLSETAQRAGNLEVWQAATQEAARFAQGSRIPDESPADAPESIRALHARHRAAVGQFAQRRGRKVAELTTRYLARLATLQVEATRAGKLEDALAYNAEVKRVQALQPAPATPASTEAAAPVEPVPATPATPAPTPPPAAAEPVLPDGVVFSEGMTPPPVPGMVFKPMTLAVTDRMRVARRLSVQGEVSVLSEIQRSSYVRSGSVHHALRFGLRSASTSQSVEKAKLVVQFYGRDLGTGTSRIVPKIMGMQKVDLPKLDGARWVFVQLPRVSAESTSYRSSYYYSGSRYGMEYYGAVVSVFDAAGALMYQAVSAPNLASLAPEKMPPDPPEPIRPRFLGDGMGFDAGVVP